MLDDRGQDRSVQDLPPANDLPRHEALQSVLGRMPRRGNARRAYDWRGPADGARVARLARSDAQGAMIKLFSQRWDAVSTVWVDVETTGTIPGRDAAVQVALVRFEHGVPGRRFVSLLSPGMPIPEAATAVHGITDEMVVGAPTIQEVFARDDVRDLLVDAQPGAFNATFDRAFVPLQTWGEDWGWPWLDPLTL